MSKRLDHEKLNKKKMVNEKGYVNARKDLKENKEDPSSNFVRMVSKFGGRCATCGKEISKGSKIKYFPLFKKATHPNCKNIGR